MSKKRGRALAWLHFLIAISLVSGSMVMAAERPPIKVGLLLPYTGTMPFQAKGVNDSVELYFSEIGMKAGGRQVQILKEDTEMNPTVGLTKVRRLVEQQRVNFIVGPVSSAVGIAIQDYVRKQNVILLNPVANTRELTGPDKWAENVFRTVETSDQCNYPMGPWIMKNTPHRNMAITGSDFAGGHHNVEAFKAGFEAAGGKVVKEIFPKLGTMDFAPYLSGLDKGVDAVYAMYVGTDAVRFVQQYQEFGVKKRLPLYGYVTIADDPYLPGVGDAALGLITSSHYPVNLDTPRNKTFVKSYTSKYGHPPYRYSEYGYTAASMIGATIDVLRGDVEDSARTAREMKRIANTLEMPSGPLAFDQYNQRIVNMYVVKTEKRDGKLVNVVIDKLGKVAQTDVWKWWVK